VKGETSYEESQLLTMLAEDSQYAFQLLFNKYKNHIYKVAALYVKSPSMAEEILQDVFMKVWLHRKTLVTIHSFESWLFTVSKNLIFNYNKRLAAEWKAYERYGQRSTTAQSDTDHKVRTAQYQQLLSTAIGQLPQQQQAVYKMAREENLSYQEIATQLSLSVLTVKTHMARALNAIRSFLKEHEETIPAILFLIESLLLF